MKATTIIIIATILIGCYKPPHDDENCTFGKTHKTPVDKTPVYRQKLQDYWQEILGKATIVERDSCQYYVIEKYRKMGFAHLGNCKNSIHHN